MRVVDEARDRQVDLARKVCRHIEANLETPLTLTALGAVLHCNPHHLQRTFKRVTGITPRQYADARRLDKLKTGLKTRRTVTMAMFEAGYGSSSRLYERAASQLGMTPGIYRRGGRDVRIRFTIVDSPLGRLLMAGTERGICAVCIDDEDAVLQEALRAEFPAATIARDDAALSPWVADLLAHLGGQRPHVQLPLDVQATAFQWRVWQELCKIPYGSTRSYTEIATALGQPTAARAVARACATNPVALIVPCHRVVRGNGDLAGYRWGIGRKRTLLEAEQATDTRNPIGESPTGVEP